MKILFVVALVVNVSMLLAQDCNNYYYMQRNKTVEMSMYDKGGDETGKMVYSIGDVTNSNSFTVANVQSQILDKRGRTIAKGTGVMKCNGGVMMINMKMNMPIPESDQSIQTNAKSDEFFIEYPANMAKGDVLKEGNMNLEANNNGMPQSISIHTFDRKVEDKEKITTPAGTWDCYKISYKTKMTIRIMGVGVPKNLDGTEWYAPGFGVVKTVSKYGSTVITSIK